MSDSPPTPSVPLAQPVNPSDVELVSATDPVVELQLLRTDAARWKSRFIAAGAGFAFLLVLAVLQFIGTFVTCNLLFASRRDAENFKKDLTDTVKKLAEAQLALDKSTVRMNEARQTVGQIDQLGAQVLRLEAQAARLQTNDDTEVRILREYQRLREIREEQEMRLRQMEDMRVQVGALFEEASRLNRTQQTVALPFQDPNYKHAPACAFNGPLKGIGFGLRQEATGPFREEEEHNLDVWLTAPTDDAPERLSDPKQLLILQTQLQSKLKPSRLEALNALAELGVEAFAATADVAKLLEKPDEDEKVRVAAAACLVKIGRGSREAVPALFNQLQKDESPEVRCVLAKALSELASPGKEIRAELEELLAVEKDDAVKAAIGAAIKRLDPNEPAAVQPAKLISFSRDVLPIFEAKCGACHINDRPKGKLYLGSVQGIAKGGVSGDTMVVPGQPAKSALWQAIWENDMPPKGQIKLTDSDKDVIRRWIEQLR